MSQQNLKMITLAHDLAKKKFGQTTVGRLLKASVGLFNPALGNLIQGNMSIEQVISSIKDSNAPLEDKIRAQEMILEAYEAEVSVRASARQREMTALASGSNDILFKSSLKLLTSILVLSSPL